MSENKPINRKRLNKRQIREIAQDLILAQVENVTLLYSERDGVDDSPEIKEAILAEIYDLFGRLAKRYGYITWSHKPIESFLKNYKP